MEEMTENTESMEAFYLRNVGTYFRARHRRYGKFRQLRDLVKYYSDRVRRERRKK